MGDAVEHEPRAVLEYLTPHVPQGYELARVMLLGWQIVCVLVTPLGWVVGVGGFFVAVMGDGRIAPWNASSGEDWVGFILFMINAVIFIFMPVMWAILCGVCRNQLRRGNLNGAVLGQRLCRWALAAGGVMMTGMGFGLGKAVNHGRSGEYWWWLGLMLGVVIFGGAVEYTRWALRRPAGTQTSS